MRRRIVVGVMLGALGTLSLGLLACTSTPKPAETKATSATQANATQAAPAATKSSSSSSSSNSYDYDYPDQGNAATSTGAASAKLAVKDTSLGKVLVDGAGFTLYTFKNDTTAGKSACNGACAQTWPPVSGVETATKSADMAGTITTITRDDGSKQIAYNGKPLYRYAADTAAGETKGEGVGGNWNVAKP